MADYKSIADNDPGGDAQAAFEALKGMKQNSNENVMITDLSMANRLGFTVANEILDGIQMAIDANQISSRVMRWIETVGIDVNNSDSVAQIDALVVAGLITTDHKTALLNLGKEFMFPGITKSDVEKARRLRSEGKA